LVLAITNNCFSQLSYYGTLSIVSVVAKQRGRKREEDEYEKQTT